VKTWRIESNFFSDITTADIIATTLSETASILNDITIDNDSNVKQQLICVFEQVENTNIPVMDDDHPFRED